jgi:predicted kinase
MPKIILCRGIQSSGKTTWAKQWVLEDPENRVRFNNDDIRNMLGKYWVLSKEQLVFALKEQFIETSMRMCYDIVIDNMNLNPKEVEFYKTHIETHNQIIEELKEEAKLNFQDDSKYELEFKDFFTPLQECIERDSKRPNPIGEEVIKKTYEKYKDILEGLKYSND